MEFRLFSGNAGTGMCRRGADEHGCEFAPVAGIDGIFFEILSVPCRLYAVFQVKDVGCAKSACKHAIFLATRVKKVLKPFNLRTLHISYIFELILFRIFCLLHHQVLVRYSSAHSISHLMLRYKCLRQDVLPALPLHLPALQ